MPSLSIAALSEASASRYGQLLRVLALALVGGGSALGLYALSQVLLRLDTLQAGGDSWEVMRRALDVVDQVPSGELYATLFFGDGAKFQYAPTSLLPFEPLVRVLPNGNLGFNLLNGLLLILNAFALAVLAWRLLGGAGSQPYGQRDRWIATGCALAAGLIFYPALRGFALGQIQIWINLAFTLACLAWIGGRHGAAGAAIGFACLLKPQLGLFLLWGLAWRNWRFVGGMLLVAVPAGLFSIWRFGFGNHLAYLEVLSFISRHGEVFFANNSMNGILHRLLENGDPRRFDSHGFAPYDRTVHVVTMLTGMALMALAFLPALLRRGRPAGAFDLCFAALCFTMASPVAWEHHYAIMLPMLVLVLAHSWPRIGSPQAAWLAVTLAAIWFCSAGRWPRLQELAASPINIVQAHLFFGAAMLLAVLGTQVFRAAAGGVDQSGSTARDASGQAADRRHAPQ
jgi:alpha-1,2-mannosyltransferase